MSAFHIFEIVQMVPNRAMHHKCKSVISVISLTHQAIAHFIGSRIPNPEVSCTKPLGGSLVDSALHLSEANKMSTRIHENLVEVILIRKNPAGISLVKVTIRNTRTRCEICLKLTIKAPERRH